MKKSTYIILTWDILYSKIIGPFLSLKEAEERIRDHRDRMFEFVTIIECPLGNY